MSHDDDVQDRVHAMEQQAIARAADNSSGYVATRYFSLHYSSKSPVPISSTAQNMPSQGPFFPSSEKGKEYQNGPSNLGIQVVLENGSNGELGSYRVESNGRNGVAITLYQGPIRY